MGLIANNKGPVRVALYARVSPKPEGAAGDNYSIAAQLTEVRAMALREFGCANPDEYIDKNASGATLERPSLDRLRDNVAQRLYDVIVCYSPDRWERLELVDHLILEKEIRDGGARLAYVSGSYEDTPEGEFARDAQALVSNYERKKFRERSRRCRRQKSREGHPHACKAPDGYVYEGHKKGKRGEYVIVKDRANVVKLIYERTAEGMTNSEVARWLNAQGIPTQKGFQFARNSVAQILEKEKPYYGEMIQNGETIKVPVIVPKELWDRAHAALARNKIGHIGREPRHYLLSGMLYCARCGKRCGTFPKRGDDAAYRCNNINHVNRSERYCRAPEIRKSILEPLIWNAVWDAVCDPDLLWEMIEAYYDRVAGNSGKPRDPLVAQIDKARRRVDRAERILADPDAPVAYEKAKADLDRARKELAEAETRGPAPVFVMPKRKDVEAVSAEFRKMRYELEAFQDRRDALKVLVDRVLYADKEAEIHCRLPKPSARKCHRRISDDGILIGAIPFVIKVRAA